MARARRTEIRHVDPRLLADLWTTAARSGTLHASDELVVCGFGVARTIELPDGIADAGGPRRIDDALASIKLAGDDGPGGTGIVAFASMPFTPTAKATLHLASLLCAWRPADDTMWITQVWDGERSSEPLDAAARAAAGASSVAAPRIVELHEQLSGSAYADAVGRCVKRLRSGEAAKVVLARSVHAACSDQVDTAAVVASLHAAEPFCTVFAFPRGAERYVGASPELLVATSDGAVSAHPLAGTVALSGAPSDADQMAWLAGSTKNRLEHAAVVDDIVARLTPLCDAISAADEPVVVQLSAVAHLGTWVDGKLRGPRSAETSMHALAALHPTPAVGGVPRDVSLAIIAELEGHDRGPWAGPVGWVDADGTSIWTLGIRGVLVRGAAIEVWAGAGIVADSIPEAELDETEVKFASVLRAFSR
jgi:menaquinone-specific isochorismate synthase